MLRQRRAVRFLSGSNVAHPRVTPRLRSNNVYGHKLTTAFINTSPIRTSVLDEELCRI